MVRWRHLTQDKKRQDAFIISVTRLEPSDCGGLSSFNMWIANPLYRSFQMPCGTSGTAKLLWLLKKEERIWFWEEGYHPKEVRTKEFFDIKSNYLHLNPVRAGIVEKEEEYLYSSCGDFYGTRKGLLELVEF